MKTLGLFALSGCLALVSCSTQRYVGNHGEKPAAPAAVAAPALPARNTAQPARNVILMIGDGMGSEHVWAAWLANQGSLNITTLPVNGFSVTTSASHLVTDSAAGGTAIACGCKTMPRRRHSMRM